MKLIISMYFFILRGLSKSNKHAAFRVWFSQLHEFRSLLPGVPFIALPATATRDTRVAIFDALLMNDPHLIMESPNKENIAYVVEYMQKSTSLSSYFAWVADDIITKKTAATRTIIYCQTMFCCLLCPEKPSPRQNL
jgi:superfamily II DNA helicase RecQ